MMPVNRSERGFISFSALFGLALLAALAFVSIKLLPPYISNYQFQDYIENLARNATYTPVTEADLRKEIIKEARGYGIPLEDRQVAVQKVTGATVNIAVHYEVPVDLLARQVVLKFAPAAGNRNIVSR